MRLGGWEFGIRSPLQVRDERIRSCADACRLLYASDIHLRNGRSVELATQVVDAANRCAANAVLLGGDMVDGATELGSLRAMVSRLAVIAPVFAIAGNHDQRVGTNRVRDAVIKGGGVWIDECESSFRHGARVISVCGPDCRVPPAGDVRVLCAHNPRIWRTAQHEGYDLVLAGHLHGCQCVLFEFRNRLFPGAVFYPYNYLSHQSGSTRLIVSRGVSDLVPIRWRCPREVVLCHV